MRTRRALGALAGAALLAVSACSGRTGRCRRHPGGTTPAPITVQVRADPEEAAVYRSLVSAYEKASGGQVELVAVGRQDHLTRLSTAFASGDAPDVFLINYREYAPFVQRGAVAPVGPLLDKQGVDRGGYYEEPLKAFSYGGALQCMPQNISSLVVYWNRALFRQAGVTPPKANWTWAEFVATAKALTTGKTKGVGIDPSITRMAPFIWSSGGAIVDNDETPTRTTLHEPGGPGRAAGCR